VARQPFAVLAEGRGLEGWPTARRRGEWESGEKAQTLEVENKSTPEESFFSLGRLMSDAAYSIEASTSSIEDTSAEVRRRGLSRRTC